MRTQIKTLTAAVVLTLAVLLSIPAHASTLLCESVFSNEAAVEVSTGPLETTSTLKGRLSSFVRWLISRRYDVQVTGIKEILEKGDKQIVFLFEHPAFIDPVILMSQTTDRFSPRPVVAATQNQGPAKYIFAKLRAFIVPDGRSVERSVRAQAILDLNNEILSEVSSGGNVALAPAGQLKRTQVDEIRTKAMAAYLIQNLPAGGRVVIVTNKGLWGSAFSYGATGRAPTPLKSHAVSSRALGGAILGNLQRRSVALNFEEISADQLAALRTQDRLTINEFLSSRINRTLSPNLYVPLDVGRSSKILPEPIVPPKTSRP